MSLSINNYRGKRRLISDTNSTDQEPSEVTTRKMTEEEMVKYGVKKENLKPNPKEESN